MVRVLIERHIAETQRRFPEARGSFSGLLNNIAFASRFIASQVRKAGLVDVLGETGDENVQGERVVAKYPDIEAQIDFVAFAHARASDREISREVTSSGHDAYAAAVLPRRLPGRPRIRPRQSRYTRSAPSGATCPEDCERSLRSDHALRRQYRDRRRACR